MSHHYIFSQGEQQIAIGTCLVCKHPLRERERYISIPLDEIAEFTPEQLVDTHISRGVHIMPGPERSKRASR